MIIGMRAYNIWVEVEKEPVQNTCTSPILCLFFPETASTNTTVRILWATTVAQANHSSANLTLDTLSSTSNGVMSPTTTTFLFSKSTLKELTPTETESSEWGSSWWFRASFFFSYMLPTKFRTVIASEISTDMNRMKACSDNNYKSARSYLVT